MSVLRKKYFSIQSNSFVDIPTTANATFSSSDVGNAYNDETVRLIRFGDDVDSSKLDQTFIDLIHNDKKLFDEYQKINSLISNGSFYLVGDNFQVFNIKKELIPGEGTYIKSFGIKSGQIKYNDEIIFLEPLNFYTTVQTTVSGGNIFNVSSSTNLSDFQNTISEGSIVFGSEFQEGTQVVGITGSTVELSLDLKQGHVLNSGSLVLFTNIPTFEVGKEIEEISGSSSPTWRRDLISYDITNSTWEVLKGTEISGIPPINTQLDVIYQILSIKFVQGTTFKVELKKNIRSLTSDFSIGDYIKISKSENKIFDGTFEVLSIDSVNFTVNIKVPLYRDNSKEQTTEGGFIDLKKVGIISILVYKKEINSQSLVFDSFKNIAPISGITGGIQHIQNAPINHYNSYFSIKTNDTLHLVDYKGRLLDWEEGQGKTTDPIIGYSYNEDNLQAYAETNIPHDHYANIENGNLTNIPFILNEVQNNIFGLKFVDINYFNIGIKNNSLSIGQEGITFKIRTYPQLSNNHIDILSATASQIQNNQKIWSITNTGVNFNSFGITIANEGSDFILIVSGKGALQIGKIISYQDHIINVTGIYKDIDTSSKFLIFQNVPSEQSDVTGSESYITSDSVKSQVLSGLNGTFGEQNSYSKVSLEYTFTNAELENYPKVQVAKWYFLSLKSYNDIFNPLNQGNPFIVTEDLNSSDSESSSSFIEIYYRTITGKYPSDNFSIEDEFGNITTQYNDRSQAPHFRPVKYQVIAKALDEKLYYPQVEDEVFVDVHSGIFKFHPDSIPRRVFVSYYKYDTIDGNSTDFSIKHVDINGILPINLQDKLSDLDYKFTQENELQKTWKVNGLISDENFGFVGPIKVNINNSYDINYKYADFTNFSFDEEKYVVKFSNHLYDTPIYIGKNNILLENLSLEYNSGNTEFVSGTLIDNFTFLDYQTGVSATTLPFVGINFFDESFLPTNDGFYSSISNFYKKKLIFEAPSENSEMTIDSGLYNLDDSINSQWNYLYSGPFDKNMVLYGLLRKNNYELLLNINCNLDVKRRLKQREFVKILDRNLNDLNSNKSITKVISEKYLNKAIVLDSTKYKENLLYLKSEIVKYKPYEFLNAQNLQNTSLGLSNITYPLNNFSSSTLKRSTIYVDDSVITAFISPNSSQPRVKIIKFIKTEETSDIGSQSSTIINEFIVENVSCNEVRICRFNENYFAVAYVTLLTLEEQNYYIKIKIFDINGNFQTESEKIISEDFPIASPFIFEIGDIGINKIGIVFQRSITEIGLMTYYYFPNTPPITTNIKIIDSENTLINYPSICKFSKDYFLVAYSNIFGSKIKIFDQDGKLQFFDDNQTIDYRTVTTNTINITGNIIKVLELDNNDIAILYLDKAPLEKYDLKLIILDSWSKNWKYTYNTENSSKTISRPIYVEQNLSNIIESISMSVLNEDVFIISYIKSGKINLKAFYNDGGQLYNSFEDSLVSNANSINLNTVGQSTLIATYIDGNQYKYSVYNFRPNFSKNIVQNTPLELSTYSSNFYFKNLLLDSNNYILIKQETSSVSTSTYSIKIYSTIDKITHSLNSNYTSITNYTLTGSNHKILDVYFINEESFKQIFILWSNSTEIKIDFFKILPTEIKKSDESLSLTLTPHNYSRNFGKIIQIRDNILGIMLINSDRKYHIHGVNFVDLRNPTTTNFGSPDGIKYTISNNIYNPVNNSLSGINADYNISFYKKDSNNAFLINPANNGTNITFLNFTSNDLIVSNSLNLNNLFSYTPYNIPINGSRQYQNINFVKDKSDDNKIYAVGNSSGSLHYYGITFSINTQFNIYQAISSSGTYYQASGVSQVLNEPQIFTSSHDDSLVLFYGNSSGGNNYYNVSFINKNNSSIIDSTPKLIFNEPSLGNMLSVQKTNQVDDFYSVYISNNKLYSKTLTLPFSDDIEYERVLNVKENQSNLNEYQKRLYLNNSIKVGGINWRGQIVRNYPIYSINSYNLDDTQIDDDFIFRSEMLFISAHLVSISKDAFTVLYYYQKDKSDQLKLKLRNFVIARSRIFPDSDWYSEDNETLSYGESQFNEDIYLQSIEYGNSILNVWIDPETKKIRKMLIDNINSPIANTDGFISQPNVCDWVLLGSSKLLEGWSTVLGYEKISNRFYTILFNPEGNSVRLGIPFINLPFDIRTATVSRVSVNKFGYFLWLYIDSNSKLNYYQHGFDGDPWGTVQLVGKNYITNIETSSNSPIYNQIKENILKTEEFKFLQYNRVDYTLPNTDSIDIYNIFGVQETGLYRIFDLNDPTLNIIMGIKVPITGEPVVSIDTSSPMVSNISNTTNKFNIFISPSSNYVTFQNITGSELKLRFYKEK